MAINIFHPAVWPMSEYFSGHYRVLVLVDFCCSCMAKKVGERLFCYVGFLCCPLKLYQKSIVYYWVSFSVTEKVCFRIVSELMHIQPVFQNAVGFYNENGSVALCFCHLSPDIYFDFGAFYCAVFDSYAPHLSKGLLF